ncbi:bromodomain-containing protein DDB_G0280777-like [Colias croceus]|uniref:bromodomain-containing protein DDB_G0280777-like n=1 Tax=Colias crocea TaxID=72248 RepID=UPI001E27A920|nr:bromodomain-containing protein DDB_G0280777-like [Colias croceus]
MDIAHIEIKKEAEQEYFFIAEFGDKGNLEKEPDEILHTDYNDLITKSPQLCSFCCKILESSYAQLQHNISHMRIHIPRVCEAQDDLIFICKTEIEDDEKLCEEQHEPLTNYSLDITENSTENEYTPQITQENAEQTTDNTIQNNYEDITITNNCESNSITNKVEDNTIANNSEDNTNTNNSEDITITNKSEDITIPNNSEDNTITNNSEDITITNNSEDITIPNNSEDITIANNSESNTKKVKKKKKCICGKYDCKEKSLHKVKLTLCDLCEKPFSKLYLYLHKRLMHGDKELKLPEEHLNIAVLSSF